MHYPLAANLDQMRYSLVGPSKIVHNHAINLYIMLRSVIKNDWDPLLTQ